MRLEALDGDARAGGRGESSRLRGARDVPPPPRSRRAATTTCVDSSASCSGTTSTPARSPASSTTSTEPARTRSPAIPRSSPASTACSGSTPTSAPSPSRDATPATPRRRCCAARRSTSTPTCVRSIPRPRACPSGSSRRSARGARPLRHLQPGPHARARGGLPSAVPLPAARRGGALRGAGDPRPAARTGRRAGRARRRGLPRGARAPGGGDREPRSRDRRPRARDALPLLRRAAHHSPPATRPTRRWRSTSRRWPRTRSAPIGRRAIAELVACPRPLAPLLSERMRTASPALRRVLLETMIRRYYRMRTLGPFAETIVEGQPVLAARFEQDGRPRHVVAAFAEPESLPGALRACGAACSNPARRRTRRDRPLLGGRRGAARGARGRPARGGRRRRLPPEVERVVVGIAQPPARPRHVGDRPVHVPAWAPTARSRTRSCAACIR